MKKEIYIAVWLACFLGLAAATICARVDLEPHEILHRYEQSLKLINKRITFKTESRTTYAGAWDSDTKPTNSVTTIYKDGNRLASENMGKSIINENYTMYYRPPSKGETMGWLRINTDVDEYRRGFYKNYGILSTLDGYMMGCSNLTIPEILHKAKSLCLRDTTENIDGHETYVLEADTIYGRCTIWIDPKVAFIPRRITVEKTIGDLHNERILGTSPPPMRGVSWPHPYLAVVKEEIKVHCVKVECISGIYIPVSAKISCYEEFKNGQWIKTNTDCKRFAINFNPDFKAMRAFVIEVPDGTPVRCDELPRGEYVDEYEYVWRNGQIVRKSDGGVQRMPMAKRPLVSVGKPIPKLENLGLSLEHIENGRILVCFFDMRQRPSRRCIIQIVRQSEQLKQKGIAVVAVQAFKLDGKELGEWVKKNTVSFPIGTIRNDEEKARFNWDVRSLPWLILTDSQRIVRATGFGVDELDAKLTETAR